ncbi:MAG: prepilin peptidase [Polyangiales bacterium]|nr:prepilin peptidase [Sandaracinaceae bacterium]
MYASELPEALVRAIAFVFGATWGSFFNVCIYRWPRHMSVVSPPSHCPACGAPVQAWRNVPILGYLLLRGRAACCGAPMTPRYVVVEVLGAVLCVGVAERFVVHAGPGAELLPASLSALAYFMFAGGLLVATFIDLEWLVIPDEVSLPGAALGLMVAGNGIGLVSAEDAALGAAMGFLFVQLVFVWAYERFTGRRGMGEGDPKLLLMIGAFLGWKGVLFAVVAGSMQGLVAAAVAFVAGHSLLPPPADDPLDTWDRESLLMYLKDLFGRHPELQRGEEALLRLRLTGAENGGAAAGEAAGEALAEDPADTDGRDSDDRDRPMIPFGPFLALGALEFFFFGERVIDAYFGLFE